MAATKFEKGKVTEKVDPKVLGVLSAAFGYKISGVDDLDYEEYHNELREAMVRGKGTLSPAQMAVLSSERKRIRAQKSVYKADFKKTRMTAADIKRGSSIQLAENSALSLYKGGVGKSNNTAEEVQDIDDKLDELLETLREEKEFKDDNAERERIKAEQAKRAKKEKNLERWKALKTTASKVIKPFRSIWDKIWGFLKTIILGNILLKIVDWMGDKKNQDKIKSIFKFLKDWWPTLLASYVLFGNSLGRFVVGFLAKVGVWVTKSIPMMIKALAAALARLKAMKWLKLLGGRRGMRALQLTSAVGGMGMIMTGNTPGGGKDDEAITGDDISLGPRDEDYVHIGGGVAPSFTEKDQMEKRKELFKEKNFNNGGLVQQFAQGGVVRGPGGVDKVPARLTAGEFVMSKGAVQKYGVNTMKAMNAAGGGTNVPSIRYNQGGPVHNTQFYSDGGRVSLPSFKFYNQPDQFYKGGGLVQTIKRGNVVQNFQGGGIVRNFAGGGLVGDKVTDPEILAELAKERNIGVNRIMPNQKTLTIPGPPVRSKTVVQRQQIQQQQNKSNMPQPKGTTVPPFDAQLYISRQKMETLGMTL